MNIKEEIKEYNKLIKKYPLVKELYIGRAKLYGKIKQYKKAFEDYEKIYKSFLNYCNIADICERNDLIKEAESFYTKAINKEKNVRNYFLRAFFYKRIGKNKKALSDCKRGLKYNQKDKILLAMQKVLIKELGYKPSSRSHKSGKYF